jgi:NAD(P) transhydrogenase subunit alpha
LGERAGISDTAYQEAGATLSPDRGAGLAAADIVVRVRKPPQEDIQRQKRGGIHISFLDPFNEPALIRSFAQAGVTAVSLEMMPRSTQAQKMDALSSQANLAGYSAVVLAASRLQRILPMMMTPAGTLTPARVFVIGVGVAGLQAIATAKRLGARVEAFDIRPVVEEQVKSLGARFVTIDLGETGESEQGYAKELTLEQLELQRQGMAKVCARSDIVVTTSKLFGREAPILVTNSMIEGMRRGSIVVDLAAESGGNVEGCVVDEEVVSPNGVHIIGYRCLEGRVAEHASLMYASNIGHFLEHFWSKETRRFALDLTNAILQDCVITHDGAVVHERFRST